MRSSRGDRRSIAGGTCSLVLTVLAVACQGQEGGDATGAGGSATGGATASGGGGPGTGGTDGLGGLGGADPACQCSSNFCGETLEGYRAATEDPSYCPSDYVLTRWRAGANCELVVYHHDVPDYGFTVYFGPDGAVSGTRSSFVGAGSCFTYDSEPTVCPGTECEFCGTGTELPSCEPLEP